MTWWRTRSIKNMPFGQKWGDFEKIINWNYYFENLILTTKYSGRDQNGNLISILTFNLVIRLISLTVWSPRSIRTLIGHQSISLSISLRKMRSLLVPTQLIFIYNNLETNFTSRAGIIGYCGCCSSRQEIVYFVSWNFRTR